MPLFNKNNMKKLKRIFRKSLINGVLEATFKSLFKDTTGITANETAIAANVVAIAAVKPYLVYVALLNQSGTNAPVAIVLENTLGGTIVWTRTSQGMYIGTLTGVFTLNKTFIPTTIQQGADLWVGDQTLSEFRHANVNEISAKSSTSAGTALADSMMINCPIEIRVYS